MGTSTGDRQDTLEAFGFVANGQVKPQLIERRLADIEDGTALGKAVIKIA